MRKVNIVLIILSVLLLGACGNKKVFEKDIEMSDYNAPAETILEINENSGTSQEKEAAELNLKLVEEESIIKKANILSEINNLHK